MRNWKAMKLSWKLALLSFLLLLGYTLFTSVRSLREPRTESELAADAGASNDRLSYQPGHRIERANSTANNSTNVKLSRTSRAGDQKYEAERRQVQEMKIDVVSGKKMANITEDRKEMYAMEPKSVHVTNPLHSVKVTTETHHFQEEHRSGIVPNQLGLGRISRPSSSRFSVTSNDEQLVEMAMEKDTERQNSEAARNKIMLTIRTTKSFHKERLPVLFDTWLTTVNASNVFLVTDAVDREYVAKTERLGMHYIKVWCGKDYSRWSLCCKSGEEMSLMFRPEYLHYDWYCHMDDDIYLIEDNLVELLSYFDAKNEDVYLGRAGTGWNKPYKLNPKQTLIEEVTEGSFHFAVGGMYCITRPLLERTRPWLGNGSLFGHVCDRLLEPEDVTVGAVMGLVLNVSLSRTQKIQPHGLILRTKVDPAELKSQVAIAYGCGQLCFIPSYKNNAVRVPFAKFSQAEDPSRFKSLHCHLYPQTKWC